METRCLGCMNLKHNPKCEHCGFEDTARNAPHQLPIGSMLQGQYTIGRCLGQGGFGITYLGWDNKLQETVAIKEYFPKGEVTRNALRSAQLECTGEDQHFQEGCQRFLREAQTLAKLRRHRGIVQVLRFFSENNTAYIVMEYIRGTTLLEYIRQRGGKLTPSETFTILLPVLRALNQVHREGMIHRDISPDNIMLQDDGTVKLLDFGTARDVTPSGEATHSTQAILKHGFAPLEQYQSRGKLGPWTDEYALCATAYYCLTGKVPMESLSRLTEVDELNFDTIPSLTENQRYALSKGMSIKLEDRYPNLEELEADLFSQKPFRQKSFPETLPINQGFTPTVFPETMPLPEQQTRAPARKRNPLPLLLVPVLLLAVLAASFLFLGKGEASAPEVLGTEAPALPGETSPSTSAEYNLNLYMTHPDYAQLLLNAVTETAGFSEGYAGGSIGMNYVIPSVGGITDLQVKLSMQEELPPGERIDLLLIGDDYVHAFGESEYVAVLPLSQEVGPTGSFTNDYGVTLLTYRDAGGNIRGISYQGDCWLMITSFTSYPELAQRIVDIFIGNETLSNAMTNSVTTMTEPAAAAAGSTTAVDTPIYSSPTTVADPITILPAGTPITILDTATTGSTPWSLVETASGERGWCLSSQLQTVPAAQVPSLTAIVNVPELNIRSGPGSWYNHVGYYYQWDVIQILDATQADGYTWYKTDVGWVVGAYITIVE